MLESLDKPSLRRSLLEQRRSLSPEDWQARSLAITQALKNSPLLREAKTILAYFSIRQEPDLSPLFSLEKTWGFPVTQGDQLLWYPWHPSDPLTTGEYRIPVPAHQTTAIAPETVDLILIPAVGMDRRGYRIGYGGGFYDRLLTLPEWRSKAAIGITFDFAILSHCPADSWDCPLNGWCTESGYHWISP